MEEEQAFCEGWDAAEPEVRAPDVRQFVTERHALLPLAQSGHATGREQHDGLDETRHERRLDVG